MNQILIPSPVLYLGRFTDHGYQLYLKRDELIHKDYGGNKWRKLKYNIEYYKQSVHKCIVSFGGPFSNHIAALASICANHNIPSVGIIRGEQIDTDNPTLKKAIQEGMICHHISKKAYSQGLDSEEINRIIHSYNNPFVIPEGGSNQYAKRGAAEIVDELNEQNPHIKYLVLAAGTGSTAAGIIERTTSDQYVFVINSMKNEKMHEIIASQLSSPKTNWTVLNNYHQGGFAKVNSKLINFINSFQARYAVCLDPIYTGKMMFAIMDLMGKNAFESGSNIMAIHTGGIQGIKGYNYLQKSEDLKLAV